MNNQDFNLSEELDKCKEENRALRNREVAFYKDIRRKYKSLSVGDTVRVPFGVRRSGNSLSFSIYSNRSRFKYDDVDCIVTGIIKKKKRNKGYPLTIEINDVWFKNEDDYGRNIRKNIGDVFVHEMKYFVIITDKLLSE